MKDNTKLYYIIDLCNNLLEQIEKQKKLGSNGNMCIFTLSYFINIDEKIIRRKEFIEIMKLTFNRIYPNINLYLGLGFDCFNRENSIRKKVNPNTWWIPPIDLVKTIKKSQIIKL